MAKSTRARSKALLNCKRSRNVDVASSFKSSSSEEDNDLPDDLIENSKYKLKFRTKKSTLESVGSDKTNYMPSFRKKCKTQHLLGLTNASVGGGMMKFGVASGRSSDFCSSSEEVKSETMWGKDYERDSSRKGPKCFSRNAVMARLNRIKKKRYLESLENDVTQVSEENSSLKTSLSEQAATILNLKNRVKYLESVLANSREISMLLKTIENSTGLPTINSLQKTSTFSLNARPNSTTQTKPRTAPPHPSRNGFPPPQRDHMYSKTPDVTDEDFSLIPTVEDNALLRPTSSPRPVLAAEEDFAVGLMASDITLPFLPTNNIPDIGVDLPLNPESEDVFDADFSYFNNYFKDDQDDKLFSDVGICLHIAESRVSLEFCETCNSSAVKAWDAECSLRADADWPVDETLLSPE